MVRTYKTKAERACEATLGFEYNSQIVDCWDMVETIADNRMNKKGPRELKEFIFVDGEGVDHRTADPKYILFGTSTGERIKGPSLGTEEMLKFLIRLKVKHPKAVFIGFALNYDVNMILRDVSPDRLERIRKAKRTRWGDYTIHYMPSKKFMVTHNPSRITFFWSDMFTYCACSFVKACQDYLGKDDARLVKVMAGKEHRNEFTYAELDDFIEPYMSLELELGVELITRLRHYLYEADIYPALWHGPGSVATALLKSRGVRHAMKPPTGAIQEASRYAYFGGRFEVFKTGYYNGPVYQADINSAYPYALTLVPNLATGEWVRRLEPTQTGSQFKLFKLRFKNRKLNPTGWNPLPTRSVQHTIHYQSITNGWYWGPEAEILLEAYADSTVVECVYEYEDDGDRPFDFINEMFAQRAEWKRTGNQAQLALKLGMNSMYGKLAQRVGWDEEKMCSPPSHQLEWAGFATSKCRAMVLEKMLQHPDGIIGVETDGIFSSVPLDVDEGKGLGQWEVEQWDGIIYIQSGVYFKREICNANVNLKKVKDQWAISKTRGFGKNTLGVLDVLAAVDGLKTMTAEQSRFVGMARAGSENWRQFQKMPHDVQWGGNGKRFHNPKFCKACDNGGTWHDTIWRRAPGDQARNSFPHVLPWLDGYVNPFQNELDAAEAVQEDFEEEEFGLHA